MSKSILSPMARLTSVLVLVLSLSLQSCKKEITADQPEVSIATLRQYVANAQGVPVDKVTYNPARSSFVIDQDALVSLKDAMTRYKNEPAGYQGRTSQRVNIYTVAPAQRSNITVFADATVPADWIAVLDQAIANWNSTNSGVSMVRVTSLQTTTTTVVLKGKKKTSTITTTVPADIMINGNNDGGNGVIATASLPDYQGNPGSSVSINTYYSILTTGKKIFALTHELGHTIGFTHTDGTYGSLVNGTPETDPNSVMNSVCLTWSNFTSYDLLAVNTVYPR